MERLSGEREREQNIMVVFMHYYQSTKGVGLRISEIKN